MGTTLSTSPGGSRSTGTRTTQEGRRDSVLRPSLHSISSAGIFVNRATLFEMFAPLTEYLSVVEKKLVRCDLGLVFCDLERPERGGFHGEGQLIFDATVPQAVAAHSSQGTGGGNRSEWSIGSGSVVLLWDEGEESGFQTQHLLPH